MLVNAKNIAKSNLLKEIDWGFLARENKDEIELIHPYPAKFIADIPRTFINNFQIPRNTAILDPFCGSGTTLVESQKAGIPSFGIDLNPIACLISKVKTSRIPNNIETVTRKVIKIASTINNPEMNSIPNLDHWYKKEIQISIARILNSIDLVGDKKCYDILKLALSAILVRISNQESDTRYAAIEKKIDASDVIKYFIVSVNKIIKALSLRSWSLLVPSKIIEGDTLKIKKDVFRMPIGMVITSPPYPNAYEYWLYHKYRMWWLGFDPIAVKQSEIGARAHFFNKNHHTEDNFYFQMKKTFDLIDSILIKNGFVCIVIGRSKIHGKIINNAGIIENIAHNIGYQTIIKTDRKILPSRKSFNLSHANIKKETVMVLRKIRMQ